MNKRFLHFLALTTLTSILMGVQTHIASATTYRYNKVSVKSPLVTQGMKLGIKKYNEGNYVGAMQEFQEYLEKIPLKDENATTAAYTLYYIALCYTQLGYKTEANELYRTISEANVNYALSHYSKIAMNCIDNDGNNEICSPKVYKAPSAQEVAQTNAELNKDKDDITKFIESGKKIHPAALDRITKERMERKLQEEQFLKKQAQ